MRSIALPRPIRFSALLASTVVLAACPQSQATTSPAPARTPAVPAATAVAPMHVNGQSVLVVPVQALIGVPAGQERATAELLDALGERDDAVKWIGPAALRRSLATSPGFAPDPAHLPSDPFLHHGERYAVEPMAGILRRYTALMDVRLAVVPQAALWIPNPAGGGRVRMQAVMLDTRSARVVWYGEADGEARPAPDDAALASAAQALAARMIAGPRAE
jgi:hypothetical protein